MAELSDRQLLILKHIVDEYIDTAEPVGSVNLEKKYPSLGVSPATIRNEMSALAKKGFLKQSHTSSGRLPTPIALKLYVNSLMKPKTLSVTDEVGIKAKVWDFKEEFEKGLREATKELASRTKSLAIAVDNDENVYASGLASILDLPEFLDIDMTKSVLALVDQFDYLNKLFLKTDDLSHVHILLGRDFGQEDLEECGLIFTKFGAQDSKHHGAIGIIGPYRCHYPSIVPTVDYFGNLIDEMITSWQQ